MRNKIFLTFLLMFTLAFAEAKIELGLESRDIQAGEPFVFSIVISDANEIKQPAFPDSDAFKCIGMTPHRQNSTQITMVNGKFNRTVINNTTYQITLLASKTGIQEIPSMQLEIDGKKYATQPVRVNVSQAEVITDIALELILPMRKCYVGQPLMATWRWYIGRNIGGYRFELPLLADEAFTIPAYTASRQGKTFEIPNSANIEMTGQLRVVKWKGLDTQCLEFRHPFIPKKAGTYRIDAGTVLCEVPDTRRRRSRNPFFDDDFFGKPMKTVSITGNSIDIEVQELPEEGRTDAFSGIIGKCKIQASATPLDVNVGDPIALTVTLSGLPYPDGAHLPPMTAQAELAKSFRISDEDSGTVKNGTKQFQCTIRANSADVRQIPPISLSYFNMMTGKYETTSTEAIPLKVHQVKTITAQDAVGLTGSGTALGDMGKQVKALDDGIAHNYEPSAMLKMRTAGFRSWSFKDWRLLYCIGLAVLYLLAALAKLLVLHRNSSPQALADKAAAASALETISCKNASAQDMAAAILVFLRAKLHLPAGAETFAEIEPALREKGFPENEMPALKSLFDLCEAIRYSGGSDDTKALQTEAKRIAKLVNARIRG